MFLNFLSMDPMAFISNCQVFGKKPVTTLPNFKY